MRTVYLAATFVLFLPSAPSAALAAADDPAAILSRLRQTDADVRQGDLRFAETRIQSLRGKTLDYQKNRLHLQYAGPAMFRTEYIRGKADQSYTEVYNGDGDFMISHHGKPVNGNVLTEIGITEKPSSEPAPHLGPAPVANYALGRGLSTLQNLSVSREDGKIIVTGMPDPHSPIRALVDPDHGYIARSITRGPDITWTFGPPVRTTDGIWVPSWAEYRVPESGGSPALASRFEFQGGTFQAPPPETFRVNLAAFDQIDDNRVDGSPTFFRVPQPELDTKMYQTPAGVTTAAQLLPYSKQQAAYEADARRNANVPPWERGQSADNRWLIGWAVLMTGGVLVLVWVVWSFRRGQRAA